MRVYGFKQSMEGVMEVENTLEGEQKFVGGYIEVLGLTENLDLVCNEEGKLNHLGATAAWIEEDKVLEVICGDCFVCRFTEDGDFAPIVESDIEVIRNILKPVVEIAGNTIYLGRK